MSISELVQSPAYKKFMGYVYGFGAAVAIIGALFKILHLPGASIMLIAGLGVEALIFALSSFEPPHEMPDWTLVYPELIGLEPEDGHGGGHHSHSGGGHPGSKPKVAEGGEAVEVAPVQQAPVAPSPSYANNMIVGGGSELSALVSAGAIEQKTIDELSEGVKRLATTTSQMADISNAASATKEYIDHVKVASDQLNQFSAVQTSAVDAGSKLAESVTKLNENVATQVGQSEQLGNSMGAVTAAYQTQLEGINKHISTTENIVNGMSNISNELQETAGDVKEYRSQMTAASNSLSQFSAIQTSAVEAGSKLAESCEKLNNNFISQAEQTEQLGKNIGAINAAYQSQLQGINSQLESTKNLVSNLSTISSEIEATVAGVKEYSTQIANLSKTVGELNSIYGNMLSAVK